MDPANLTDEPQATLIEPMGVEYAVVMIGLGALILLFFSGPENLLTWLIDPASLLPVTDVDGSSLTYRQSAFFWADLGLTLLGILLIFDGAIGGLTRWAWARLIGVALAIFCLMVNGYVVVGLRDKIGMQIVNGVAIIAGVLVMVTNLRSVLQRQRRG